MKREDEIKGTNFPDPKEIEKHKKEVEMKKRMTEDNQIQAAISVLKGISVYKKLQTGPISL